MFVQKEEKVVFLGTPSSVEERKILADAGFVHVTGLAYYNLDHEISYIGEQLMADECGRHDYNNGLTVVVLTGGEVWLKAGSISRDSQVISEFCPNGTGAFVPLSNGEHISHHDLLFRMANPNYNIFLAASS